MSAKPYSLPADPDARRLIVDVLRFELKIQGALWKDAWLKLAGPWNVK